MPIKSNILSFFKSMFKKYSYKKPLIKENTFLVWEPCSYSHAEVLPGYVKYLIDLGYHVSVIFNNTTKNKGLFSKFENENYTLNKLSKKEARKFFLKDNLEDVKGVLVTTIGKLCDEVNFEETFTHFNESIDRKKIFTVSHEAKGAIDANTWSENIITLRALNYKNAKSTVINPHYFGDINTRDKNKDLVNFITIGAIQTKRKNNDLIIDAVRTLHEKSYRNFKVTVVGKGHLKNMPLELQPYFDIKGSLSFDKMYDEIEKADFMLTSYDENNKKHLRYNTTGTSGNFQLVYGFLKPCLIIDSFSTLNGFDDKNTIIYKSNTDYADAMIRAIELSKESYKEMQNNLAEYVKELYLTSLNNLKNSINK